MRLVADANVLISELTRTGGQTLVDNPALQLWMADAAWDEVIYETPRRFDLLAAHGHIGQETAEILKVRASLLMAQYLERVPFTEYVPHEEEARVRIAARDPRDWPTVAVAPARRCDIWTRDKHFLGCGVATWTTETLFAFLAFRRRDAR